MGKFFNLIVGFAVSLLEKELAGRSDRVEVEKAKALMKVADFHLARFHKSQEIEWLINISFWVLVAVAGGFLIERVPTESLPVFSRREVYYAFGLVMALGHFLWLSRIQSLQHADKLAYFKCRDKALEHIRSLDVIGATSAKALNQRGWSGVVAGSLVTLALAWGSTFFVLAKAALARPELPQRPVVITEMEPEYQFSPNLYLTELAPLKLSTAESLLGGLVPEDSHGPY